MKVTKAQLKQIIKEELEAVLGEKFQMPDQAKEFTRGMGNKPDKIRKCKKLSGEFHGQDEFGASDRDQNKQALHGQQEIARDEYKKLGCDKILTPAAE